MMNTMFSYFKPKDRTFKRKQEKDEDAPKHKKQKQEGKEENLHKERCSVCLALQTKL